MSWVLLSNACALYHNDIYCIKKTYNSKKRHECYVFLMQQFMMVMKYVHIIMSKKTKIKSSVYMNDIYVQRFVLYSNILWTTKKKEKIKQQKHFVHKQLFTICICMCCSDFDSFLFQYSCLISFYWWLGFHMFVLVIPIIFSPNNIPPPSPQGKIPPDFWQGMWGGDASVAKFHTETYNCVRYAWIVHARDTYRRKIGILCACTVRADFEHVDIVRA
jgi:hypothetical protein